MIVVNTAGHYKLSHNIFTGNFAPSLGATFLPTFTVDGNRHFVCYITGPSRIRLGLTFSEISVRCPAIVCQSTVGTCDHGEIDQPSLIEAVAAGVREVSGSLYVVEIVYVTNDSPRYSLYRHCAHLLAERFLQGST